MADFSICFMTWLDSDGKYTYLTYFNDSICIETKNIYFTFKISWKIVQTVLK